MYILNKAISDNVHGVKNLPNLLIIMFKMVSTEHSREFNRCTPRFIQGVRVVSILMFIVIKKLRTYSPYSIIILNKMLIFVKAVGL